MKGNDTDSLLQEIEEYYEALPLTMKPTYGLARTAHLTESKDIVKIWSRDKSMIEKLYETLKMTMQ